MVRQPEYLEHLRTAVAGQPNRNDGSRTITIEDPSRDPSGDSGDRGFGSNGGASDGVLYLRGGPSVRQSDPRVRWQDGTVDNEFLNRKKSKICCIYHKPRTRSFEDPFADDSSSESDSSDGSSSGDDEDTEHAEASSHSDCECSHDPRSTAKGKGKAREQNVEHAERDDNEDCEHAGCTHSHDDTAAARRNHDQQARVKPNAYEIQPRYGKFKKGKHKRKSKQRAGGSNTITERAEQ